MIFTGIVETLWEDSGNKNIIKAERIQDDYYVFTEPETYADWSRNKHHWTTKYVWKNVIPLIVDALNIPFEPSYYDCISNIVHNGATQFDVSYHRFHTSQRIKFENLSNNEKETLDMSSIRCNAGDYYECTAYHALFRGFHSVCVMQNETSQTNRALIVNCDSMSIPIIPIIIPFYKNILILDNRTNKSFRQIIKQFMSYEDCDVIEIFHAECWNHNKRHENLK